MAEIRFEGLGEPVLAQYLAALGIFRALSAQYDTEATLSFKEGVPAIESALDADAWVEWVMQSWRPSPIASPWNRGAGFYGSSKTIACTDKRKRNGVEILLETKDARLDEYRDVLSWICGRLDAWAYANAEDKDQKQRKPDLLARLRAEGPDGWLPWLDAATVLERSAEGDPEPGYLALLGSGGNDGRLDLGNNFMLHLASVVGFEGNLLKRPKNADAWSRTLLRGLLGEPVEGMLKDTAGQLAPSSRKAPNGVSGAKSFAADEQLNPWLFLWSIQGSLLFAGASTRRLGSHGRARAAFPFHAERVDAGYGTAAEVEKGKDELWLPAWDGALTYREVRHLFGEARAQVGRRRAQTGLDYARALGGLGATRGVQRFMRFALVERAGQSNIAIHAGTFSSGTASSLDRLRGIDGYLQSYRQLAGKKNIPARFTTAWRAFESAVLDVARRGDDPSRVTTLLAAIGRLRREQAAGLPKETTLPKRLLRPGKDEDWVADADPSEELLLAASLAGLDRSEPFAPLRAYLWSDDPKARITARDASRMDLVQLLGAVLNRRLMEHHDPTLGAPPNRPVGGRSRVGPDTLLSFLAGDLDDERILDLVWLFADLDGRQLADRLPQVRSGPLPAELSRTWMLARLGVEGALPEGRDGWISARPSADIVHAIEANRTAVIVQRATHVLRAAGATLRAIPTTASFGDTLERRRHAAALAFPLPRAVLMRFRDALTPNPDPDSARP
ncbi:MAG: type I-U CRISPR-associated protein Csx17 [Sandaracinaceae bacterium]